MKSMLTFKQFLSSQDDNIGVEEAVRRYSDYRADFKRHQISEFFVQHKDEEWYAALHLFALICSLLEQFHGIDLCIA